ncbi:tRNA uridine-5-carboxymethylaminomethyl(34) synthesis enzyme MnmG [Alistipes sp.]|uniref:tRNA uridine-5-carboxymethylaminomethyl(34) synthesis enzyme MnmG n=1 Tax=Alistipes sp. TaxID=1872444 RepID=UPI003AF142ED
MTLDYDIVVIGGGHAGCEAAAAAARLGSRTLLLTMDMAKLASMSCNPAVGGVAKGQIVREIDALGGQMGRITDLTAIQFRMLNRSKGAAMWSPRAQCDKTRFSEEWRHTLENTLNLYIWQDAATELLFEPISDAAVSASGTADCPPSDSGADRPETDAHSVPDPPQIPADPDFARDPRKLRIRGVRTRMGVEFSCRAVILTAGTFLEGMMHCGASSAEGGRAGDAASHGITDSLRAVGFDTGRMKTGTPARLDARTIDFEQLEPQYGDEKPGKFSFSSETEPVKEQLPCFLVYTTPEVHATLRGGFALSPLFNGTIRGIGPRYCPSIEDKLRTFADKEQHQLFLEPEGRSTNEYYLNGFSSSLPWEVQWEALHKIRGFEDLHIFRPGYAIEYDYFPPTQLHHSLETKRVAGLYFAGQVNGTTGYEEAAAQGLMAGINAHRALNGAEPVVLKRDEAYIGVLIDDLVTKGVDEPYRMFTSRAEYRILLRQDNADIRLTPLGHEIGLISKKRYAEFRKKNSLVESLISYARSTSVRADEINDYLKSVHSDPLTQGRKLYDILMRNDVTFENLQKVLPRLAEFIRVNEMNDEVIEEAEIQIKYKGYIERENFIAEKLHRLENIRIPSDFDYNSMNALTIEARQKLSRIRPETIGQASRIPGVSPADVNVLLVKFGR